MCIKGYIGNSIERVYYQLRGLGKLYFVPLAVMYILMPVTIYIDWMNPNIKEDIDRIFMKYCDLFLPIMSIWWVCLVLREYVEGDGNELLFINGKLKLPDVMMLYIIYIIHLIPVFLVGRSISPLSLLVYFKIIMISFMYCGTIYFFVFLIKGITISILPLLCYTIFANGPLSYDFKIICYTFANPQNGIGMMKELIPFFLVGILLLVLGTILNHFKLVYK